MVDAAAQCKETFKAARDICFNLLRRHAVIERCYDNNGDIDLRKEVNRHACHSREAHD
jgi:hypothetical protein